MSPGRLLQHFEQISEASDAVPRLRRFILDLAVRGKLVEQDPADEPTELLIRTIHRERDQRTSKGDTVSIQTAVDAECGLFPIPRSWRWVRLGFVTNILMGQSPAGETYNTHGDGVALVNGPLEFSEGPFGATVLNQFTTAPTKLCRKGDLLLCVRGSTTGRTNVAGFDACIGRGVAALQPLYADQFVRLFVWSWREHIIEMGRGIAFPSISRRQIEDLAIPFPPLAEQHRIVGKVDELMALCDEVEAAQAKRERRRDRLVAATLHGLNNGDASAEPGARPPFEDSARFYFNHLPRLTTRPEHIHQLRQTILNLAVRGRLVRQELNDKPLDGVETILLSKDEAPFDAPENWRWTHFGRLGQMQGGGTPSKSRPEYWNGDIPWVSPKDMKRDHINSSILCISPKAVDESSVKLIQQGSILFVVRGMILAHSFPVALSMIPLTVNQDMKALTLALPEMGEFVIRALKGLRESILSKVLRSSHGTCRLDSSDYLELLFPLPPLAEQHRIVAKVDELMAICDELETRLTTTASARRQLIEATLHEALEVDS